MENAAIIVIDLDKPVDRFDTVPRSASDRICQFAAPSQRPLFNELTRLFRIT